MSFFKKLLWTALLSVTVLFLTGCGGTTEDPVRLSPDEYLIDTSSIAGVLSSEAWPYMMLRPDSNEQIEVCRQLQELARDALEQKIVLWIEVSGEMKTIVNGSPACDDEISCMDISGLVNSKKVRGRRLDVEVYGYPDSNPCQITTIYLLEPVR